MPQINAMITIELRCNQAPTVIDVNFITVSILSLVRLHKITDEKSFSWKRDRLKAEIQTDPIIEAKRWLKLMLFKLQTRAN